MSNAIFLLLGSNLGDRPDNLRMASQKIETYAGKILRTSAVYRTAAWGNEAQPDFYNQVLEISSSFSPEKLLQLLLDIEWTMGRKRAEKWGPRLIDIDLLFYGSEVVDTKDLSIPHPGIPERKFVLVPLAEIAPALEHPVLKKTMTELLRQCKDTLGVEKLAAHKT